RDRPRPARQPRVDAATSAGSGNGLSLAPNWCGTGWWRFAGSKENRMLQANPATTVKGARREEKEPAILYKELLYEASDDPRDYAIIMTLLQTGIRLSELAALLLED